MEQEVVILEGVTILNQFEVVTKTVFNWSAFWVGVLIAVGIALIVGIIYGLQENSFSAFMVMFITISLFGSALIGCLSGYQICPKPVEYETHYEVSIDANVNLQEFMDKYEIIETRGLIYTVREKE